MMTSKRIVSLQNPLIKKVLQLKHKGKERTRSGLFVLEGQREFEMACKGGYQIETLLYFPEIMPETTLAALLKEYPVQPEIIELAKEVYQKLAYREKTEGILAVARTRSHELTDLSLQKNPLILVAEAPEKPGNIGALLRTADAASVDAVLIANPKSDLYNPNIIRSSVGCVFTVPIAMASSTEIIGYLKRMQISIFAAALNTETVYTSIDYTGPTAIVVGTEATGLSDEWLSQCTAKVIIPMEGFIDSMNVSVSAAILIFEAKRQRAQP